MTELLDASQRQKLTRLAELLVDQNAARVIVPPQRSGIGHWFGGGNMIESAKSADGALWAVGRFRNQGDSRTGLGKGERGLELAIFRSDNRGETFEKVVSLSKSDLNVGDHEVLSIEGTALRWTESGVELYVSTEKSGIVYPDSVASFLKPGTGVWSIDRLSAATIPELANAEIKPVLSSDDPRFVQVKDPFVMQCGNDPYLMFCTHPFCWSSSNTGYASIKADGTLGTPVMDFFPRGFTWDVAMTRGTAVLPIPQVGEFAGLNASLLFYDGGECVRDLDQHAAAVSRPRGYSCEELGGVAVMSNDDFRVIERLSVTAPLFVSPHGTGCSRYVDALQTERGVYVTWQQSQSDSSQPLVLNFVSAAQVSQVLS